MKTRKIPIPKKPTYQQIPLNKVSCHNWLNGAWVYRINAPDDLFLLVPQDKADYSVLPPTDYTKKYLAFLRNYNDLDDATIVE